MLKDALTFLQEQALKNQVPTVEKINPHVTLVKQAGKTISLLPSVPRTPHRYIRQLSHLMALLNRRVEAGKVDPKTGEVCPPTFGHLGSDKLAQLEFETYNVASEGPVCYVSEKQIDYVETPNDARGLRVRMPLTKTPPLLYLERKDNWMDQDEFVRMLWIDFNGCFKTDVLLKSVENVNFSVGTTAAAGKQGERASVSREIKAEAVGASKVPEEVDVYLNLFDEIECKTIIRCAVELDASNHRFKLTPFPSEVTKAYQDTFSTVGNRLAPIQSYHGEYEAAL